MTPDPVTAADERMVIAFMQQLRATPLGVVPRMPAADVLMLKAQLVRRWDAQRKVRLPIDVMEPFEIAATIAAAGLLLFWSIPSAFDWIPRVMF
jgi:hypothetical protein